MSTLHIYSKYECHFLPVHGFMNAVLFLANEYSLYIVFMFEINYHSKSNLLFCFIYVVPVIRKSLPMGIKIKQKQLANAIAFIEN